MKFSTALALAALAHLGAGLILWRSWPTPPAPAGEVVALELRSAEPPAPEKPPAPVAAGSGPAAVRPGRRAPRIEPTLAILPEPGGEVSVGPPGQTPSEEGNRSGAPGGTGPGSATGSAGGAAAAGPAAVDHGPLKAEAMERIRQQRHYPELARRRRLEGTVVVAFRVQPDGAVANARIKQGVDEMLDQAALEAVRRAAPLPGALFSDGELEVLLHFGLTP